MDAKLNEIKNRMKMKLATTHQCSSSIALDFCLLNTRGSNKGDEIVEFVTDNDIDILAMTETWLKPDHVVARGDMTPAGYSLYEEPRPGEKRGGGVAILCKANLKVKTAKRFKAITFESINQWEEIGSFSCCV